MFHATKHPSEDLDWSINWSPVVGTGMSASSWAVSPATGMTMYAAVVDDWFTTVRTSGGTPGAIYVLTNLVTPVDDSMDVLEQQIEIYVLPT